jgi:hypothetical protein
MSEVVSRWEEGGERYELRSGDGTTPGLLAWREVDEGSAIECNAETAQAAYRRVVALEVEVERLRQREELWRELVNVTDSLWLDQGEGWVWLEPKADDLRSRLGLDAAEPPEQRGES